MILSSWYAENVIRDLVFGFLLLMELLIMFQISENAQEILISVLRNLKKVSLLNNPLPGLRTLQRIIQVIKTLSPTSIFLSSEIACPYNMKCLGYSENSATCNCEPCRYCGKLRDFEDGLL